MAAALGGRFIAYVWYAANDTHEGIDHNQDIHADLILFCFGFSVASHLNLLLGVVTLPWLCR